MKGDHSALQDPDLTDQNRHQDDSGQTNPKDCQEHDDLLLLVVNPKNRL